MHGIPGPEGLTPTRRPPACMVRWDDFYFRASLAYFGLKFPFLRGFSDAGLYPKSQTLNRLWPKPSDALKGTRRVPLNPTIESLYYRTVLEA